MCSQDTGGYGVHGVVGLPTGRAVHSTSLQQRSNRSNRWSEGGAREGKCGVFFARGYVTRYIGTPTIPFHANTQTLFLPPHAGPPRVCPAKLQVQEKRDG